MAAKQDLACGRIDQAVDAANERRFAGPGRADDRGHAAPFDSERDVLEHRLSGAILLAQIANDERAVDVARQPGLSGVDTSMARRPSQVTASARPAALLLLRQCLGLALGFRFEGRLVVGRAGSFGDLAHHFPGVLVGDREEAVVAIEFLAHRGREVEGEEAGTDLLGEIRMEIVRVGEGRGREQRAREDDAEVIRLQRAARDHPLEHVGSDAGHVVVAGRDAERRFVVPARHQRLVVLVRLEALRRIKHERREIA